MNAESRRKARLWLGLVFVLGAALGSVLGYAFARRTFAASYPPRTMSEPERRAKRLSEMTKEIGLTADQAQQIDAIIKTAHEDMGRVHEKAEADVDAMREKARNQIRGLLTEEQKPKFEAMVQRFDQERKKK